ncbi:MAG: hypothetical protein PWP04_1554 [Candidatus Atribacteria bacterium]|nr:hypothetical protein [Candidatus Atribacteria bacterium]
MKIVGIAGSPRRLGNSDTMLSTFLEEISSENSSQLIIPSQLNIHFCQGCRYCEVMGKCAIEDDAAKVFSTLLEANLVIVSSPVFFYGFPACLKALIDRSQVLWSRRHLLGEIFPKKAGFLLVCGATKGKKLFDGVRLTTRYFFDSFNCEYQGEILLRGLDKKGDLNLHPDYLTAIRAKARFFLTGEVGG